MEEDNYRGAEALTEGVLGYLANPEYFHNPGPGEYVFEIDRFLTDGFNAENRRKHVSAGLTRVLEVLSDDHEYKTVVLTQREDAPLGELFHQLSASERQGGFDNTPQEFNSDIAVATPADYQPIKHGKDKLEHNLRLALDVGGDVVPVEGSGDTVVVEGRFDEEDSAEAIRGLESHGADVVGGIYLDSNREIDYLQDDFADRMGLEFAVPVLTPERAQPLGFMIGGDPEDYLERDLVREHTDLRRQGIPESP